MLKKVIWVSSKIISGVIYLLIAVAALLTLAPMVIGYRPVIVLSGSMEPIYPVGSIIYYKASSFENIEEGDAITFRLGGGALATHRVIRKDEAKKEFVTKGDNNPTEDVNPVSYELVEGSVGKIVIPYAGFAGNYVKKIQVIMILGVLLIACSVVNTEKESPCEQ